MKKINRYSVLGLVVLIVLVFFFACRKEYSYPRPSREYYVNDFADALLPGTKYTILAEGERLYETTRDTDIGGTQVVVVTLQIETEEQVAEIDKTTLFREWGIGGNDMGLLILLLFKSGEEKELISIQIEIGYNMEAYITAIEANNLVDDCFYNPDWEGSLDMGLGQMYYEFLNLIYTKAYGYTSFTYDMEEYYTRLIETTDTTEQVPMNLIAYLFSPYGSLWAKMITILFFIFFSGMGISLTGLFFGRKGGGGSSGGYGIFR